ncbi:hypothetical protein LWP59_09400 [Amycolatopsis acidiphila]|uniref:DUF4367 domain-containing protein n=1 Tax=Amycolatopsis acidiphila TaxID=715473 RepID=A0A558A602_9PSEU|nr:hypothetical protein [Amycolatopsis acidiphila]TVT19672.1 hypothetical protein FNH06_23460 [Amycolatopsis acidiphila]UIJ61810.1 hypothetical protein LWP59_09400 [Amycolatopsis acidiphila]GHG57823.1 hypothetical protein GCM10017788_09700 [Amycolatopsis acidiphila]
MTTVGLGLGAAALRQPDRAPDLPVAASVATTVAAPELSFSLADSGYRLTYWSVGVHETSAQYSGPGGAVGVTATDTDPELGTTSAATSATLHGDLVAVRELGGGKRQVSWHAAPGHWLVVQSAPLDQDGLLQLAGEVR